MGLFRFKFEYFCLLFVVKQKILGFERNVSSKDVTALKETDRYKIFEELNGNTQPKWQSIAQSAYWLTEGIDFS